MKQLTNIYAGIVATAIILQTYPSPSSAKLVTIAIWPLAVTVTVWTLTEREAEQ